MDNSTNTVENIQILFSWYDYTLFSLMLAFSALIGVWFGFIKKQSTPDEYLLGGKEMKIFPITLSLIASSISGTTLLAVPSDVYRFGWGYGLYTLGLCFVGLMTYYVYLPVFYKIQIRSTYEYVEMRFNARLRVFASFLFMISSLLYLPIVIYIPALAFSQATGMNLHLITPIVCAICIFYTTIGGLKAVVWTDALQFGVMMGAIIAVFYMGIVSAGGLTAVWTKASIGNRNDFDFDLNPTKKDGFFAILIGGTYTMIGYIAIGQGFVQKYLSLPNMQTIKTTMVFFIFGGVVIVGLTVFTGLIIYAKYADCDPFTVGEIFKHDQILSYYVMDVSKAIPGLAGLFLSGLFSAALSTLSSCLNSLSGTIYEDFIASFMPKDISKKSISNILKVTVAIIGIVCTALVFVVDKMGEILPIQISLSGITAGPLLGIFTLGMLFPFANSRGAMVGTVGSLLLMTCIITMSQHYQYQGLLKNIPMTVSIDGCDPQFNYTIVHEILEPESPNEDEPFFLFRISYYYYTLLGTLFVLILGIPASWLLKNKDEGSVSKDLISPIMHWSMPKDEKEKDVLYYPVDIANHIVYTEKK